MLTITNIKLLSLFFIIVVFALSLILIIRSLLKRGQAAALKSNGRTLSPDMQLRAVPTYRRTLSKLSNELARVRRYNRPLTIVVLKIESDQLLVDLKRSLVAETGNGSVKSYSNIIQTIQLVFSLVGSILSESLRESDIATYDVANNQYIIVLPESDKEQAMQTVRRLKKLLFKRTAGHLVEGIAEFPGDGLIIEELVKVAMTSCENKNQSRIQPKGLNRGTNPRSRTVDENHEKTPR